LEINTGLDKTAAFHRGEEFYAMFFHVAVLKMMERFKKGSRMELH
jgi:hypothetical protein